MSHSTWFSSSRQREDEVSPVSRLLELVQSFEFFRSPDGFAWAMVQSGARPEICPVSSAEFEDFLVALYYASVGDSPPPTSLKAAISILRARVRQSGKTRRVGVRVLGENGVNYFDLGRPDGRLVRVTADGWDVVENSNLPLWRPPGMLPLIAAPSREMNEPQYVPFSLQTLLGLSSAQGQLVTMWLMAALMPIGPYPVLHLVGEPSSGKATLARMLKAVIDPSDSDLIHRSREASDLLLVANSMHVLALANLSSLSQAMADVIRLIATGGSLTRRRLYADQGIVATRVCKPVILLSTRDVVRDAGLRTCRLRIDLDPREPQNRQPLSQIWDSFAEDQPHMLAGLLQAVCHSLANTAAHRGTRYPGLADFAHRTAAAAPAFGWTAEEWLATYAANLGGHADDAQQDSALVRAIVDAVQEGGGLRITATDLLERLRRRTELRNVVPGNAKALGVELTRLEPSLRHEGVVFRRVKVGHTGRRLLVFEIPAQPAPPR